MPRLVLKRPKKAHLRAKRPLVCAEAIQRIPGQNSQKEKKMNKSSAKQEKKKKLLLTPKTASCVRTA